MGEFEHSRHASRAASALAEQQADSSAPGRAAISDSDPMSQQPAPSDKALAMLAGGGDLAGEPAAAATQELDADAYGAGQDVFFGAVRPRAQAARGALAYAAKSPAIDGTTGTGGPFEPLDRFRQALAVDDAATASAAWVAISPTDKLKLKTEGNTLVRMLRVIGPDSIAMLHQIGVTPAADRRMVHAVLHHGATTWVDALDTHGMLDEFLQALPRRKALDPGAVAHLAEYTRKDLPTAKAVFEKAYGELRDGDLNSDGWTAHGSAWDQDRIRRLYRALQEPAVIPPSHLAGLSGIYVASHYTRGGGGRIPLGFGYFAPSKMAVVLPLYAGDGSAGHDMIGGPGSKGPAMKHFTSTILHEVGHLVGESTGEHAWGTKADSPLRMEASSAAEMREELWDPAKSVALTEEGADPVSDKDAKLYIESKIREPHSSIYQITAWAKAGNDEEIFYRNVDKQFAEQPLYKMAKAVAGDLENAYLHPMAGTKTPSKMFAYLRRFDQYAPFAKYERAAFDAKPSWYSVSSPKEWFAEQYTYYMTTGGQATLPAVQKKLQSIVSKLEKGEKNRGTTNPAEPAAAMDGHGVDGPATAPTSPEDSTSRSASRAVPPVSEQHVHRFEIQW